MSVLSDTGRDLVLAARSLRRSPSHTLVAVLVLALAIGSVTVVASIVNGVLLRPLPYDHPERVAYLWQAFERGGRVNVSVPELNDYRERSRSLEAIGGFLTTGTSLSDETAPERVQLAQVTPGFFEVFGIRPALGRIFTPEEAQVPFGVYAVISDGLWRRKFAADPAIVGKSVRMNARQITVVGVMPPGFDSPRDVEVWRPLVLSGGVLTDRSQHFINVVARIRPGFTMTAASREVHAAEQGAPDHAVSRSWLVPIRDELVGNLRPLLLMVTGAVVLVLLIACANVAHLTLVRAAARRRDMAVRTALGASRARLVRQLVAESVLLSAIGAVLGTALAVLAVRTIVASGAGGVPQLRSAAVDPAVLGAMVLVTLLTALLAGVGPALSGTRTAPAEALSGARTTAGVGARRLRGALVVAEVALSLTLLVGASLLARSVLLLRNVNLGFREENVLTLTVSLPFATYSEQPRRVQFFDRLLSGVRGVPGVQSAGAANILPMTGDNASSSAITETNLAQGHFPELNVRAVTPGFLETLGVPLLEGRMLAEADGLLPDHRVALLNHAAAERLWPGQSALGRRVSVNAPPDQPAWREIVGVVGDVRQASLDQGPQIEMYEPHHQAGDGTLSLAVRTSGDPWAALPEIRQLVRNLDTELPVFDVRTMSQRLGESINTRRFAATVVTIFSVLALVLAAVGLYGVVAFSVSQRTREIGVRLALGARRGDIGAMVVRNGVGMAVAGIVTGSVMALLLTRLIRGLLFGVTTTDPISYVGVASLLAVVAAGASWLPARRASGIDPVATLREEG